MFPVTSTSTRFQLLFIYICQGCSSVRYITFDMFFLRKKPSFLYRSTLSWDTFCFYSRKWFMFA